ncbi:hypothetical protein L798_13376 [Zootermopsis nevadensis]|uniref:Slowpoke-binding protein n=1 Tax=Zootermopsis nevadensis TaxID=136037 RepID=A0A067QQG3_ZOONE|nr:hypothetical protein L798_13376 [Zootermopsis nevadensis]
MFNIYQSISRKEDGDKELQTTGHDRFCTHHQPRSYYRRRKRPMSRRAQSVSELQTRVPVSAKLGLRKQRSVSTDDEEGSSFIKTGIVSIPGERTPLLANRLDSLAKLFSRVTLSPNGTNNPNPRGSQRHGGRYEYTALEADSTVHERMELERKSRERAQNACQHYLRSCSRYALLHHLNDIGSRVDKHWFVVNDTSMKTERLLTLVPLSPNCAIECNANTRSTILELFLALQHPYIYPVLDLDFRDVSGQTYVILVLPFNNRGSLKDLIYKVRNPFRWQDDWSQKYGQRSAGLPVSQVQRLGRQILEALVFLKNRGFPPCSHLHSGNIILQNGVAR